MNNQTFLEKYEKYLSTVWSFNNEYPIQELRYINKTINEATNTVYEGRIIDNLISSNFAQYIVKLMQNNELCFENLFNGFVKDLTFHIPVVLISLIKCSCGFIVNVDDILQHLCIEMLQYISCGNEIQTMYLSTNNYIVYTLIKKFKCETSINVKFRIIFTLSNVLTENKQEIRKLFLHEINREEIINILIIFVNYFKNYVHIDNDQDFIERFQIMLKNGYNEDLKIKTKYLSLMKEEVIRFCNNLNLVKDINGWKNFEYLGFTKLLYLLKGNVGHHYQEQLVHFINEISNCRDGSRDPNIHEALCNFGLIEECVVFLKTKGLNSETYDEWCYCAEFCAINSILSLFKPHYIPLNKRVLLKIINDDFIAIILKIILSKEINYLYEDYAMKSKEAAIEIFWWMIKEDVLLNMLIEYNVLDVLMRILNEICDGDNFNKVVQIICYSILNLDCEQQLMDKFINECCFDVLMKALLSSLICKDNIRLILKTIKKLIQIKRDNVHFCINFFHNICDSCSICKIF